MTAPEGLDPRRVEDCAAVGHDWPDFADLERGEENVCRWCDTPRPRRLPLPPGLP